jgi:quinol monooxygenase YgiN
VLMRCTVFIFFGSALMTLMPLVAKHELGMEATGFGGLLACMGVGALIGAMILPGLRNRASIDQITAVATVVFALTIVGLALIRSVDLLYLLMTIGGVSWITVMASFTVAAQTSVPAWVQSRALGFYTLAFQGSWAISSAGWGFTASAVGNRTALLLAAGGLMASLLATLRRPLAHLIELDLRPSMHWPEPVLSLEPQPEDGPVLILVEYDIDPEKADGFIAEIHELARIRRRDGAIRWGIHRDLSDPRHFVEHFVVESWAEHLRQHMRGSVADREVEKRVFAYHTGPEHPKVSHLIEQ